MNKRDVRSVAARFQVEINKKRPSHADVTAVIDRLRAEHKTAQFYSIDHHRFFKVTDGKVWMFTDVNGWVALNSDQSVMAESATIVKLR